MSQGIDFRVFVSSTFGDMVAERGVLQNEVFPRVDAYCRARGATFRAIDLRWGISDEAARDRRTMGICLAEVRRCHRASPALNFIALIGSRYGWRPLPGKIDAADFEALRACAAAPDRRQLVRAYNRDDNAVPACWVLRAQHAGASIKALLAEEQVLRAALDRTLARAWPDTDARGLRYGASATHLEIAERFALDIDSTATTRAALFYVRAPRRPGEIAPADRAGLAAVQASLHARVGERGLFRYEARDLATWRARIERDLIERARGALRAAESAPDPDPHDAQQTFAQGLAAVARGHDTLLARVRLRLDSAPASPIIVTGVSGSGKSTLLARIWTALRADATADRTLLLTRFVGSTSESRDLEGLLRGLCAEIDRADARDETPPIGVDALAKALRERLDAHPERRVIVVVDALDQLDARSAQARLAWLPCQLPSHVQVLASALEDTGPAGDTLRALRALLPRDAFVPMRPLAERDSRALLATWLGAAGRRLQPPQTKIVLAAAARCPTPLYLRLATIEAGAWRSFDRLARLATTTETLLARRFAQFAQPAEHGETIVRSSLALLGAARHGLSESEMLPLLSGDAEVMAELARRSPHWPLDGTLPFVVWARLRADLAPYLTDRAEDGSELMAFFHGAIQRAAEKAVLADGTVPRAHADLARFFAGGFVGVPQPNFFTAARSVAPRPNLRKLSELTYQQTHAGAWNDLRPTLEDLLFVRAKCNAGLTGDLVGDYERALDALDAAGQADTGRSLGEWQSFVVRERAAFEAHAAIGGFVLQQALNAGGAVAGAWRALPRRERNKCALQVEVRTPSSAPLATLVGHAKGVADCVFDASGKRLFTSGMDGKVLAWRTRGWDLEETIAELPDSADSLALSIDGRRIATACADNRVRIHALATRTALECEGGFERHPRRCRFVNGDRELLVVGYKGIRLYHARTGRLLKQGLDDAIFNDCAPGPGSLVTLGDCDGGAYVFDLKAWKTREHVYLDDVVRLQGSALTADGARLLTTGGRFSPDDDRKPFGATAIWRLAGRGGKTEEEVELERHAVPALNCMFIDAERAFVVGLLDGTLCVHRSADGKLIQRVRAHDNGLRGLALSPDGSLLASAAFDGKVRIWSVATLLSGSGDDAAEGEGKLGLYCALDGAGRDGWALTATVDNPLARVQVQRFGSAPGSRPLPRSRRLDALPIAARDPGVPRQVFEIDVSGFGARAAHRGAPFSSDGPYGVVHSAARYGASEFFLLPELAPERWSRENITWARSIDGRATALLRASIVRVAGTMQRKFDLLWYADDTRAEPYRNFTFTLPLAAAAGMCQFSLRPHFVLLALDNEVHEFGIDGGTRVVARMDAKVSAYVEADDWQMLLVGTIDGGVSLWKLGDATPLQRFAAHRGEVVDLAFLDAERFFTAGKDGTLRLWRVRDGHCDAVHVADAALVAVDAAGLARRVIALDEKGNVYWMRVLS